MRREYVFGARDVREIDAYNERLGLGPAVLMSNFAREIAAAAERMLPAGRRGRVLTVAGPGNNGGDGAAAARILARRGALVDLAAPLGVRSATARIFYDLAGGDGVRIVDAARTDFDGYDLIIDALFGIGLDRDVTGETAATIAAINAARGLRLAVDVPSGLDETGRVRGAAVRADATITACGYKTALIFGDGQDYAGGITIADLGCVLPRGDYPEYVREARLPPRKKASHKGGYADVYVIGGSARYPGAGLLAQAAARAALRSGAGLARLVVAECDRPYFTGLREEMIAVLPAERGLLKFDAAATDALIPDGAVVALGPGGGPNPALGALAGHLLGRAITLILDADGINMFRAYDRLGAAQADVLFTPHVKEFSRMTGTSVAAILADPLGAATGFARAHRCSVLLKAHYLVAADGERVWITAEGTPAQAKGGSGDTLCGATAALCRDFAPAEAGIRAGVLLGHAARAVARELGEHAVLASDTAARLK